MIKLFIKVIMMALIFFVTLNHIVGVSLEVEKIPVGVLTGFTGDMAPYAPNWYQGALLSVKEVNEAGGPLGQKLEVFPADDRCEVEGGMVAARKLVTMNRVVGIVGGISDVIVALIDFVTDNKVPIISPTAGTIRLDKIGGEYIFRTVSSDSFDGRAIAKFIIDQGWNKVGMIALNTEGLKSVESAAMGYLEEAGVEIVSREIVNPGQATYRSTIRKVFTTNPDVVVCAIDYDTAITIYKERFEMGYTIPIVQPPDPTCADLIENVGKVVAEGIYGEAPAPPRTIVYQTFLARYKEFTGEEVMIYTPNFYDAMNILALAIEAAGKAENETVAKYIKDVANPPGVVVNTFAQGAVELRKGNDINYHGVTGPCDFDEYGNVLTSKSMMQVQNGEWVEVKFYSAEEFE